MRSATAAASSAVTYVSGTCGPRPSGHEAALYERYMRYYLPRVPAPAPLAPFQASAEDIRMFDAALLSSSEFLYEIS